MKSLIFPWYFDSQLSDLSHPSSLSDGKNCHFNLLFFVQESRIPGVLQLILYDLLSLLFFHLCLIEPSFVSLLLHAIVCFLFFTQNWWNFSFYLVDSIILFNFLFVLFILNLSLLNFLKIVLIIWISFFYINFSTCFIFWVIWIFHENFFQNLFSFRVLPPFFIMSIIYHPSYLRMDLLSYLAILFENDTIMFVQILSVDAFLAVDCAAASSLSLLLREFVSIWRWAQRFKLKLSTSNILCKQFFSNLFWIKFILKPRSSLTFNLFWLILLV